MSAFSVGAACVQRVDHGEGKPLTFDEAVEAVDHPLSSLTRYELVEVVGYLACQSEPPSRTTTGSTVRHERPLRPRAA